MGFKVKLLNGDGYVFRGWTEGKRACSIYCGNSPVGSIKSARLDFRSSGMRSNHMPVLAGLAQEYYSKKLQKLDSKAAEDLVVKFILEMASIGNRLKEGFPKLSEANKELDTNYTHVRLLMLVKDGEIIHTQGLSGSGHSVDTQSFFLRDENFVETSKYDGNPSELDFIWVVALERGNPGLFYYKGLFGVDEPLEAEDSEEVDTVESTGLDVIND